MTQKQLPSTDILTTRNTFKSSTIRKEVEVFIRHAQSGSITTSKGKYHSICCSWAGGHGKVYICYDTTKDRFLIEKRSAPDLNHVAKNEINLLKRINGAVGPKFIDSEGDSKIFMEIVDGETLDRIKPIGNFNTFRVFYQCAERLRRLNKLGVVHRDIKPENIIDTENQVELIDFGVSILDGREPFGRAIIGTDGYISPEQIEMKPVDSRADVYCLGGVYYEILAKRRPFYAIDQAGYYNKHLNEIPADIYVLTEFEGLKRIALKCLEKDPDKRFEPSELVEAVAEEIRAITKRFPILGLDFSKILA